MKWRPLITRTLTKEEFLKKVLKDRLMWKSFDEEREGDRHYMGEALNYILRLEAELNDLRARCTQQETH